tara:strand:+ start:542 stop:1060 length:519 start_codon:yes stop_codon:yes gene_type:complete
MAKLHYKILISDVDGVMNDGKLLIGPDGEEPYKNFNVKDGMGIKLLQQAEVIFAVISGRGSKPLQGRMKQLGVNELHMRVSDKKVVLQELLNRHDLNPAEAVYIGDDVNDIVAQKLIKAGGGLFCCPSDAVPQILKNADLILTKKGGEGVLRELIDRLIENDLPILSQNIQG